MVHVARVLMRSKPTTWLCALALGLVACSTPPTLTAPAAAEQPRGQAPAPGQIVGQILRDASPAADVPVVVFAPLRAMPVITTKTNAEGHFEFPLEFDQNTRTVNLQIGDGDGALDLYILARADSAVNLSLRHEAGQWQTDIVDAEQLPVDASRQAYQAYLDEALALAQGPDGEDPSKVAALIDRQWAEIGAYDDPTLRTMTRIHYATYLSQLVGPERFVELFELVAADDPLWAIQSRFVVELLWVMGDLDVARDYAAQLLAVQREPGLLAAVRYAQLINSSAANRGPGDAVWDQAWAHLTAGELAATEPAANARARWDDARPFVVGKQMPALVWASLEGDGEIRTADLAGRPYLLDVWSTWCRPCMESMPALHQLHDQLNGDAEVPHVVFLSLSIDEDRSDVARVRAGEWPMPWLHAWSPKGEVVPGWALPSMPLAVLVGADGVVLAVVRKLEDPAFVSALGQLTPP